MKIVDNNSGYWGWYYKYVEMYVKLSDLNYVMWQNAGRWKEDPRRNGEGRIPRINRQIAGNNTGGRPTRLIVDDICANAYKLNIKLPPTTGEIWQDGVRVWMSRPIEKTNTNQLSNELIDKIVDNTE